MPDTRSTYGGAITAGRNYGTTSQGHHNRDRDGAAHRHTANVLPAAVAQGPVTLFFPEPLSETQRHVANAEFPKHERMQMLYEAIKGVNCRLRGQMAEDDDPDYVKPGHKSTDETQ